MNTTTALVTLPNVSAPTWGRHHHPWLYSDPDGYIIDFGYDIMRRSYRGQAHDVAQWVARQCRMLAKFQAGTSLSNAVPVDDLVYQAFLVPDCAPASYADPQVFWTALQAHNLNPDQHLWAGPTMWFPQAANWHQPTRRVREFVQKTIVDSLLTPAHIVIHDPARLGKSGDLHAHVMISVQKLCPRGFAGFVPSLVQSGCQMAMWQRWQSGT
ncbi:MAG: hypothetical protein B7Y35_07445 [Sphingomonadales bacterium 28-64-96]|nr:MAG: hypothetical protein B7Y35_07445 [Sphingomonadales bacterium 28-64-96]